MKKYQTPEVEITPIYTTDVFTQSSNYEAFDLLQDKFD